MTDEPVDLAAVGGSGGVVWSASPGGFHTNLVVLDPGGAVAAHRNDALAVLVVVLAGSGTVMVDGVPIDVAPTAAVVVPRGAVRGISAGPTGLRYLTVHGERAPFTVGRRPSPPA